MHLGQNREIKVIDTQLCKDLEHFETPLWAAKAILNREILTNSVFDPCTGTGVLSEVAKGHGYSVVSVDIHDWGYPDTHIADFLSYEDTYEDRDFTVFMNPPFSKAVQFVEKAISLNAKKIVCFQRLSWWESQTRRDFWVKNPPVKVLVCGDRAASWRHDIPLEKRDSTSPTAHAWFIWERGHSGGTALGHIWKDEA